MSPEKMTSEPQDLQNDLQATQNRLHASQYVSEPPRFCLHAPHFGIFCGAHGVSANPSLLRPLSVNNEKNQIFYVENQSSPFLFCILSKCVNNLFTQEIGGVVLPGTKPNPVVQKPQVSTIYIYINIYQAFRALVPIIYDDDYIQDYDDDGYEYYDDDDDYEYYDPDNDGNRALGKLLF